MQITSAMFRLLVPAAVTGMAWAAGTINAAEPAIAAECRWTEAIINIDGRGDEAAWRAAPVAGELGQPWLTPPAKAAEAATIKLLWDREWLYFLAEMNDRDIHADLLERESDTWKNDAFGLFLKPSAEHAGYYEFRFNAAGAAFEAFLPDAAAIHLPLSAEDGVIPIESRTALSGTLSRHEDTDKHWHVEGRVPWTGLLPTGGRPAPGEVWHFNCSRSNHTHGRREPELSSAAPLTKPEFHRPQEFTAIRFHGPEVKPAPRWKNERLHGSPEGPPKYAAVRAWPGLPCRSAVTVAAVPGGKWMWLVDQTGGWEAPVTLWRFRPGGDGSDAEPVLNPGEVIYSVEFHPGFAENRYVYFGANGPKTGGGNASRVVRYSIDDGRPDPASRTVIIEWPSNGHNGAGVAFGGDGMLYVTSGDGSGDADADNVGQNPQTLRAKVLRINVDRPDAGRAYSVPPDNPFLSDSRFAPETWAYGLRNPWRLSFDRNSGQMWLGENGNDRWEMARLVQRGANYGWSRYEGSHDFLQNRELGPQPVTFPTIEHPHSEFRSLTGGFVYRGRALPELTGAYIYGDFGSGRVRAALHDGTRIAWDRELLDTSFALSLISAGSDGEIVLGDYGSPVYGASVTGALYRLEAAPASAPAPPFPSMLSETGLFTNVQTLAPADGVLPYQIAAPGWHDGATGEHHLALPEGSGALEWQMAKSWTPANGAALAQTLTLNGRRIETRILLRQQNDWAGYSYLWNDTQTDAALAPKAGDDIVADGRPWRVPSRAECLFCHTRQANFSLTLHESQLNAGDQLARWEALGLLQCDPAAYERNQQSPPNRTLSSQAKDQRTPAVSRLLPRAPNHLRRFVRADDTSAPVAARARSYLGVNCAHCHTLYGGGNSVMDFDWLLPDNGMRAFDQLPQHGDFGLPGARIIRPGHPGLSVLVPRMTLRGPGQMPPAGTFHPDPAGLAVLVEWIATLPSAP